MENTGMELENQRGKHMSYMSWNDGSDVQNLRAMLVLRMAGGNTPLCKHGPVMGRKNMTADKGEGTEVPGGWMGPA